MSFNSDAVVLAQLDRKKQEEAEQEALAERRKAVLPALTFDNAMRDFIVASRHMRLTEDERDCLKRVQRLWLYGKLNGGNNG